MKNILSVFLILTLIAVLTVHISDADRLIHEHTINRYNKDVDVTQGHPW